MSLYQFYFTEKEIRIIIDRLKYEHKDLVHTILEQIFKKDLTNTDVDSILYK